MTAAPEGPARYAKSTRSPHASVRQDHEPSDCRLTAGVRPLLAAVAVVLALGAFSPVAIEPQSHDVFLRAEESDSYALDVRLAKSAATYGPVDLLFLFDATGSMQNVIRTVADEAVAIMQGVREANPETAFAVASFADYAPGAPVWELQQDITTDLDLIRSGLERIRLRHGEDWPEAYSRALFEARFIQWRPAAQRYLILFGDAPAHDPTFYGTDFGIDPGRDGLPGTADDLRFETVVKQLSDDRITAITIYDRGDPANPKALAEETLKGFSHLASATGGLSRTVGNATEVADAIRSALIELPPPTPRVEVAALYRDWVKLTAVPEAGTAPGEHRFRVAVRPSAAATPGIYRIPLTVVAGEGPKSFEVGESLLIVRLGWLNYPWFWPVLIAAAIPLLILVLIALGRRQHEPRLAANHQFWNLLWRLAVLFLVVAVPAAIVLYLPETPAELGAVIASRFQF